MKKKTTSDPRAKAKKLLGMILDKHPQEPMVLDLRNLNLIWDFFIVVSSGSGPHARAMAEGLNKSAKNDGIPLHHIENDEEDNWFLLDYNDVCVHIFSEEKRAFYSLEQLFKDAKKVRFRY
ncbi:ribosome silencing factor [Candidatus Omnitrophota bacterium]